ncbi:MULTISPECIES: FDXHR family putative zinc-binding protein [Rhodococcus]|uniref:FDXHR family putative zinc-binding protein n=2 Tax=Rhodococcus erythropolis TaxID=1833 RepID=UPI000464F077
MTAALMLDYTDHDQTPTLSLVPTKSPQTPARPAAGTYQTNCCNAEWSGQSAAHCSACHNTFTGTTAFDQHRRGGECRTPEASGLVRAHKWFPCFGWESADNPDDAFGHRDLSGVAVSPYGLDV